MVAQPRGGSGGGAAAAPAAAAAAAVTAADVLPDLPPPGPSQLEIRFRRLLHQCALRARAQHASDAPGAAAPWQADPKFHCYVESLREMLYDLESSEADRPGPDVLAAYKGHVGGLARELRPPDVPAFCRRPAPGDDLPAAAPALSAASAAVDDGGGGPGRRLLADASSAEALVTSVPAPAASSAAGGPQQQGQPQQQAGGGTASAASAAGGAQAQFSISAAARGRAETQRRLQDELAEDMLGLTAEMKAGAMAMQNAIRYRGKLLDETESALVDSSANAHSVAAKAKERYRAGRSSFCWTCMMLLAVTLVFAGMMVYIKLTAMVGITGRRAPAARPRLAYGRA